jgi:putative colanic acid biosynthesis acetyltransferase WcaF
MPDSGKGMILDAQKSRPIEGGPSFGLGHRLYRAVWAALWLLLAAWTPAPLHRWRVLLLRLFGADIAWTAHVYASARIWYPPNLVMREYSCLGPGANCYSIARVVIGPRAVVSQRAYLCTGSHDILDPAFQLVARPIAIGADAWVAAESFVGPGVTIGEGAVLGARAVAFQDLDAWTVYLGNPAAALRKRARQPS